MIMNDNTQKNTVNRNNDHRTLAASCSSMHNVDDDDDRRCDGLPPNYFD